MLRPSYEARVLVIAFGRDAWDALRAVDGEAVRVVDATRAVPGHAPVEVGDADVVILAASEAEPVADTLIRSAGLEARRSGCLVAGACLMTAGADVAGHHPSLRALRESVDMLLLVRTPSLATEFIEAVRGGAYRC